MDALKMESIKAYLKNKVSVEFIAKLQNDKNTWSIVYSGNMWVQCYRNEVDHNLILAELRDGFNFKYFMINKSTLDLITDSDITSDARTVVNMYARHNLMNEFKYWGLEKETQYGYTDEWL